MKKIFLILFLLPAVLSAQVKFLEITFDEAQKKAQKEGKAIFVDVYRSQPENFAAASKKLVNEVLSDKDLAAFMEKNFVLLGIDMSKPENDYFRPLLNSLMYPCVAFYTDQGVQLENANWYNLQKDKTLLRSLADKSLAAAKEKKLNSRKIAFKDMSFEDALAVAKKENKMLFIDAYTDWCRPCRLMDLHVFSLNRVADFYNENFIPLKIEFDKGRPDLAAKYNVKGFPTYLFINANGDVVYTADGYKEAEAFIAEGKAALKKFNGIEFFGGTWAETLSKAKNEHKFIFLDCYASWCGPCKVMAATTFKDPEVADYFNETFVNSKIDMEKGEGVALKEKYKITAYPTLLFIDADGNIVHRVLGSMNADEFLAQAKKLIDGKGLAAMTAEYEKGNTSPAFVKEYIEVLGTAGSQDQAEKVVGAYLSTVDKSKLLEPEYWNLFEQYVTDVNSDLFAYVYANKEMFGQTFDPEKVNQKLYYVWQSGTLTFVKREGNTPTTDEKGLDAYIKRMKKEKVEKWEQIAFFGKLNIAEANTNWKDYTSLISKELKKDPEAITDMVLYNYALRINQKCSDPKYRLTAAQWLDERVGAPAVEEKKPDLPEGAIPAINMTRGFKDVMVKISKELKEDMK